MNINEIISFWDNTLVEKHVRPETNLIDNRKLYSSLLNFKIDKKYWYKDNLTGQDYDIYRSKPAPFIKKTIEVANILNLKTIVEIGSTRFAITKKCVDYFDSQNIDPFISPPCCCDGHSTFFWTRAGFEVFTVDIDENCSTSINWSYGNLGQTKPDNLNINIPCDGINFLNKFSKKIDLLYLDGWDKGTENFAENHLLAYEAAKDKLSDVHLILIDDTDYITEGGGKDKLLSPYLIDIGYELLFNGRQTLFLKKN